MKTQDKKYLSDIGRYTSFSFVGEIARYLFLIITSAIVTNTFGVKVYGQYAFVMSFLLILITISGLGISRGVVFFGQKFIQSGNSNKASGLAAFSYIAIATSSGVITVLVMVFSKPLSIFILNSAEYAPLLLKMAPLIIIEALYGISLSVLRSRKRIARFSFVRNVFYHMVRISIIIICFILLGFKGINGIIISTYIAYLSVLIYNIISQLKRGEVGKRTDIDKYDKRNIIKYSMPLFMSAVISILLRQTDIIMIGNMINEEAVAIYKIAVQLCMVIPFVSHITGTFFDPMISSQYHAGKKDEMIHTYRIVTKWTFTVGFMVFIGIILFGKSALHLFGKEFVTGHIALIMVACGALAKVITGQSGSVNAMTGHSKINFLTSAVIFAINIALNIILIPIYGIVGAAFATLVSNIIGNFTSLIYLYIKQKIQPYDLSYFKPIAAGAAAFGTVYFINKMIMWDGVTDILIKSFIFIFVFLGTILLLKIDDDEKIIINSIFKSIFGFVRDKNRIKQIK